MLNKSVMEKTEERKNAAAVKPEEEGGAEAETAEDEAEDDKIDELLESTQSQDFCLESIDHTYSFLLEHIKPLL